MSEHLHYPVPETDRLMVALALISVAEGARVSAISLAPAGQVRDEMVAAVGGYGAEDGLVPENGYAFLQNIEVMIQSLTQIAALAVDIALFDGSLPEDLREDLLPGEFVVTSEDVAYAHRSA